MSDLDTDFVEIQVGGGRPDATAPPVLTPTRLRTSIKAADRDGGLISKARIRRTHQTAPSITENPNKSLEINPFLEEPEIGCASELFQTTDDVVFVDFLQTPSRKNSVATCSQGSPTPKGKVSVPLWSGDVAPTIPTASVAEVPLTTQGASREPSGVSDVLPAKRSPSREPHAHSTNDVSGMSAPTSKSPKLALDGGIQGRFNATTCQ